MSQVINKIFGSMKDERATSVG